MPLHIFGGISGKSRRKSSKQARVEMFNRFRPIHSRSHLKVRFCMHETIACPGSTTVGSPVIRKTAQRWYQYCREGKKSVRQNQARVEKINKSLRINHADQLSPFQALLPQYHPFSTRYAMYTSHALARLPPWL